MTNRVPTVAITALVCLPLGILLGVLIHSSQSYSFQTQDCPVGSDRGFGHITGFFRKDSEWRGGVSKTDGRGKPEWLAFYNREGEREGPVINFWPEGNISHIKIYRNDELHGQYITFSMNGNLESMAYYKDGELVEESYFQNTEPAPAMNDFFAAIERANVQQLERFTAIFLHNVPEGPALRKND
jgi:hypothetical protein